MIQKVVQKPVKIDLHIHSAASKHKDGSKVSSGTADNLPILVAALNKHGVNMASITDHDCFDYQLFDKLRDYASQENSLDKVLPGIEFSVAFTTADGPKTVHVITIFDDSDDQKLQGLQAKIPWKGNAPDYDCGSSFSEEKYWEIIRSIGLNIVTIAHQKASPGSSRKRANDANSVGDDQFNEFLFMEYFEAYEYKNRRNELFNKTFAANREVSERLRFITGSDCHQWDVYPGVDVGNTGDLPFTYLKCLPTFRGLAMAVTDISRIKTVGSFFSGSTRSLDEIVIEINGKKAHIPLSPGINAIIGDNSVGKSSIMNSLVGFDGVATATTNGQKKYLEKVGVKVVTSVPAENRLCVDGQESIRKLFENLGKGKTKDLLGNHFPEPIDTEPFKEAAAAQIELLCNALSASCGYQAALSELPNATILPKRTASPSSTISFQGRLPSLDEAPEQRLVDDLKSIEKKIESLGEIHSAVLKEDDLEAIDVSHRLISEIRKRHEATISLVLCEKKVINAISTTVQEIGRQYKQFSTDAQKLESNYIAAIEGLAASISDLVKKEHSVDEFSFEFESIEIEPKVNPVGPLSFVSKTKASAVNAELLQNCLKGILKARRAIDFKTVDCNWLVESLKNYPADADDPIEIVRQNMTKEVSKALEPVKAINRNKDDVYEELSQGFNAQLYFSLLRDTELGDGIYFVDQPEDQISQKAIKEVVINEFRDIAESRQVVLITHNPQFLVNLDVDNVIFIGRKDGSLTVQSGALEFECMEYKMLDVVAENVDGGLDAIRKRMKRYEKAN